MPREISEHLFILCDTTIEGEPSRDEPETVLAEAVAELVDANYRAEKEIERFQRRFASRNVKRA